MGIQSRKFPFFIYPLVIFQTPEEHPRIAELLELRIHTTYLIRRYERDPIDL
jgi:hypothetical protein